MLQFSILTIGTFVTLLDSITIYITQHCFKINIKKYIPIFSLVYGLILGIAGYFTPNVEMGTNLIEAIFIGLSAGAAATGINQVGKQLGKEESNNITSIILYLKKIIDDENKTEDTDNEISCDEYPVDDVAVPSVDSSEAIEEDVPSTTDCSEGE